MLHPEVHRHNESIKKTVGFSNYELPDTFAIWRDNHADHWCIPGACDYSAAIVKLRRISVRPPIYTTDLVPSVESFLGRGECIKDACDLWLEGNEHKILIQRPSFHATEHNKLYLTDVQYANHYIQLERNSSKIPVLTLSQKCMVLAGRFLKLREDYNTSFRFIMKIAQPLVFPPIPTHILQQRTEAFRQAEMAALALFEQSKPPVVVQSSSSSNPIPQYILNGYIENLITKHEDCPLIMEPLVRETTCVTPCGHAMSVAAAERWIVESHACPVCRKPCSKDQLQMWKE